MRVAVAARNAEKASVKALVRDHGATAFTCDCADTASVRALFKDVEREIGFPDLVVFNASAAARGPREPPRGDVRGGGGGGVARATGV